MSLLALKRFRVLCIFFQRAILQQPLLHQNQAKTATITCMATPTKAPAAQVRPVMNRFCFQEGLVRHSTARPTPAPVHRPATRLEKRRAPSTYSWVSNTLAAQLGIRPTRAATTGWKKPI